MIARVGFHQSSLQLLEAPYGKSHWQWKQCAKMKLLVFNFSLQVSQTWGTGLTMTCRKAYRKRMHRGCMTNLASSLCDRFGEGSPSSKTSINACVDRFIHSFLWKILAPGTRRGIFIPEKYRGTQIYVSRQVLRWVEHRRLVPRITKSIDWRAITWDNVGRVQCVAGRRCPGKWRNRCQFACQPVSLSIRTGRPGLDV